MPAAFAETGEELVGPGRVARALQVKRLRSRRCGVVVAGRAAALPAIARGIVGTPLLRAVQIAGRLQVLSIAHRVMPP